MADKLSKERRSANMARIRSKDTKPELAVRRMLHALGYRYRLHGKDLPGKPDVVFAGRKKVIFVHGCFWHQHPAEACLDGRRPKSNAGYWDPKLNRNVARDRDVLIELKDLGWKALTVWECEVKGLAKLRAQLEIFLGPQRLRQRGVLGKAATLNSKDVCSSAVTSSESTAC
jgi:DNA mismatch endonuclease (patch repair protein)